jgi:hypothetical protein
MSLRSKGALSAMAAQTGAAVAAMSETGRESASAMNVRRAWYEHKDACVLRYECQVALLAARCSRRYPVEGENQRSQVCGRFKAGKVCLQVGSGNV